MGRLFKNIEHRFLSHVIPEPNTGCWVWASSFDKDGYGQFEVKNKRFLSHRFSWKIFNGEIPNKKFVCHKCDNTWCVNPIHLFLGSHRENMKDMVQKNRWNGGRPRNKKCKNGHFISKRFKCLNCKRILSKREKTDAQKTL